MRSRNVTICGLTLQGSISGMQPALSRVDKRTPTRMLWRRVSTTTLLGRTRPLTDLRIEPQCGLQLSVSWRRGWNKASHLKVAPHEHI